MANTKKSTEETSTKKQTPKKKTGKEETVKKTASKKSAPVKKVASTKTTTKKVVSPKKEEEITSAKTEVRKKEDQKNTMIKGIIIAVLLIIFFIIIIVIGNNSNKGTYSNSSIIDGTNSVNDVQTESENIKEDEMKELTSIDIEQYLELKKGSEYAIIYIGRPTCSHCQVQLPIMKYMAYKYDVTVNYLNTDTLDDDGISKLQKSDDYFSEGWGTPLILIVKDNEIIDKSEGETSIEEVTDLFKKYGLISE